MYEIRVKGHLDGDRWSRWFEGVMIVSSQKDETILHAWVADQAALYGLLARLRDLALPLLSVKLLGAANQGVG